MRMRYAPTPNPAFRHEALIYRSEEEFLAGTVRFVRDAVAAGEPVLVAVSPEKAGLISARLNGESEHVFFADMPQLGRNPARIIPVWREFVAEHLQEGSPVRGIGEPIWPERSPAELVECQRHEWLLNLAFADAPAWWLLCPYDAAALDSDVLETAYVTHPCVADNGHRHASSTYCDPLTGPDPFHGPLPPPAEKPDRLAFTLDELLAVRRLVSRRAAGAGLGRVRREDLLVAVNEVATNSLRHAGGQGTLSVWREDDSLLCEVRDSGLLHDPLVGRACPTPSQAAGRGLWLANQLCDLAQIRSLPDGNVVRLRMSLS